mmetsp:Transcript_67485/g.161948  ORF Transcript_67485/g.161948 Transcript_67485/m.161948 type:complete len:275 (-) Transcript_67485:1055-1879(-)
MRLVGHQLEEARRLAEAPLGLQQAQEAAQLMEELLAQVAADLVLRVLQGVAHLDHLAGGLAFLVVGHQELRVEEACPMVEVHLAWVVPNQEELTLAEPQARSLAEACLACQAEDQGSLAVEGTPQVESLAVTGHSLAVVDREAWAGTLAGVMAHTHAETAVLDDLEVAGPELGSHLEDCGLVDHHLDGPLCPCPLCLDPLDLLDLGLHGLRGPAHFDCSRGCCLAGRPLGRRHLFDLVLHPFCHLCHHCGHHLCCPCLLYLLSDHHSRCGWSHR